MAHPGPLPPGFAPPVPNALPQILQENNQVGTALITSIQNVLNGGDHGLYAINIIDAARAMIEARTRRARLQIRLDQAMNEAPNHNPHDASLAISNVRRSLNDHIAYEQHLTRRYELYAILIQSKANGEYNQAIQLQLATLHPQALPAEWNGN